MRGLSMLESCDRQQRGSGLRFRPCCFSLTARSEASRPEGIKVKTSGYMHLPVDTCRAPTVCPDVRCRYGSGTDLEDVLLLTLEVLQAPFIHRAIRTSRHQPLVVWRPDDAAHSPIVPPAHTRTVPRDGREGVGMGWAGHVCGMPGSRTDLRASIGWDDWSPWVAQGTLRVCST